MGAGPKPGSGGPEPVGAKDPGHQAAGIGRGRLRDHVHDLGLEPDQVIDGLVIGGHGLPPVMSRPRPSAATAASLGLLPARPALADPARRAGPRATSHAGIKAAQQRRGTGAVRSTGAPSRWLRAAAAQEARTASISRWRVILSATTTPPFCMGALKLTLKSRRLSSPLALNPARVPP